MITRIDTGLALEMTFQSTLQQPVDGPGSPLGITCKRCSAYRGDPCRWPQGGNAGSFCAERVRDNRRRLLALPTFAVQFLTPCCGKISWLVWRSTHDLLVWVDVPCTGCGAIYVVERYASDYAPDQRVVTDRLNPHMVEMTCWAIQ